MRFSRKTAHPSRTVTAERFSLIHVGKCAGSSVAAELQAAGYCFQRVHVRKPPIQPDLAYVILVRDPASRFVSAFHWRKHVLHQEKERLLEPRPGTLKHRFEHELLEHFDDANALAEQIDPNDPTAGLHGSMSLVQLIGHVPLGFAWYLDGLLERVDPTQLLAALAVESLATDMERVFGITMQTTEKMEYPGKATGLSSKGRANLEQLFDGEYRTLRHLARRLGDGGGYRPQLLEDLAQSLA